MALRSTITTANTKSEKLRMITCHVLGALSLMVVVAVHGVTAVAATATAVKSISAPKSTGSSDSAIPVFHFGDSNNNTSALFAPNDPYRWREQLIQRQKRGTHRQLDVEYRSILVVRIVNGDDSDGSFIENEINNVLFYEQTQVTVQQQMKLCSGGRIIFQPANDGIIAVQINLGGNSQIESWTTAAAEKVMKDYFRSTDTLVGYKEQLRRQADHVLIILPESLSTQNFVANAEIGRTLCVFNFPWLSSLSAYMHEMGHNLELRHSGRGSSQPYADTTGYMGVSNPKAYGPQKCYNAAQHWFLNFYDTKRVSLTTMDITAPVVLKVAAFVDHEKVGSDYTVLVQVSTNTYLQFNRAKSYNVGTEMMPDQIVVISDSGDKTVLIAGLDATSSVLQLSSVAIDICSINIGASESGIDFAVVAVGSSNNGNMCGGVSITSAASATSPTNTPTNPPVVTTSAPITTPAPVNSPTPAPVNSPTPAPVDAPTPAPVLNPASLPTSSPTTYAPSTYQPTVTEEDVVPTVMPTVYYVSSPHPTDEEEKDLDDEDEFNPVVIKTPIFSSSSDEIDTNGGEITVQSSSKTSSSSINPVILSGILAFVGVAIVAALVTMRRMAIHRYYSSKPLRTNEDDDVDNKSDRTGSTLFFEDIEVSTNGFVSSVKNLLNDYELDLGNGDVTAVKNIR